MHDVKKIIEKHGGREIEYYTLINNYGYRFKLNGVNCDLRYWANCYGVALDYWRIHTYGDKKADDATKAIFKKIENEANKVC